MFSNGALHKDERMLAYQQKLILLSSVGTQGVF